jgi:hypothetical protein
VYRSSKMTTSAVKPQKTRQHMEVDVGQLVLESEFDDMVRYAGGVGWHFLNRQTNHGRTLVHDFNPRLRQQTVERWASFGCIAKVVDEEVPEHPEVFTQAWLSDPPPTPTPSHLQLPLDIEEQAWVRGWLRAVAQFGPAAVVEDPISHLPKRFRAYALTVWAA